MGRTFFLETWYPEVELLKKAAALCRTGAYHVAEVKMSVYGMRFCYESSRVGYTIQTQYADTSSDSLARPHFTFYVFCAHHILRVLA